MIAALALAAVAVLPGMDNRLWWVELELRGPCDEVRLDCGPDGVTTVVGPFAPGEDRTLRVPVPVRSPLGEAGLGALPLPSAGIRPAHAGASARVLGWSSDQPATRVRREAGVLLARPRPAGGALPARAGRGELLAVALAGAGLLALRARSRLAPAVPLSLAAGATALVLASGREGGGDTVLLVDWEPGGPALAVTGAAELALPYGRLEVVPPAAPLALRVDLAAGTSSATSLSPGARLYGLEPVQPPALAPGAPGRPDLAAVWTRDPSGRWSAHGPWTGGRPLSPGLDGAAGPPGWLAGALPPGRAVLLARAGDGRWLRCVGVALEDLRRGPDPRGSPAGD